MYPVRTCGCWYEPYRECVITQTASSLLQLQIQYDQLNPVVRRCHQLPRTVLIVALVTRVVGRPHKASISSDVNTSSARCVAVAERCQLVLAQRTIVDAIANKVRADAVLVASAIEEAISIAHH